MIEFLLILICGVVLAILLYKFYKTREELLTLKERQKMISQEILSRFFDDIVCEKIKSVIIPKSMAKKVINLVSKEILETISPFTIRFKEKGIDYRDCIFLGEPIDYIVFEGWKSKNKINRLKFLEVKTKEGSELTQGEKDIKDLVKEIDSEKIKFEVIDFSKEKTIGEKEISEIISKEEEIKDIDKQLKNKITSSMIIDFVEKSYTNLEQQK